MSKNNSYPEAEQSLEASLNLGAEQRFVSFSKIYQEVKRLRLENGLMADPKNLRGRIRRSLYFNKNTAVVRGTAQSKQLSISARFPYDVIPKHSINVNDNGLAKTDDIEENSFMLNKKVY